MGTQQGEDVYATLLLSDTYLPGALVLAHSLRDAGTTKRLAVLVTLDTVSAEVVTQLKAVFDHVISVPRIRNSTPANLYLMNRPDLHSAFTKINLWKQVQFRKIVYLDADVVALRAPDELFNLSQPFSAAPDIGWPDIFNTGVMALTPNLGDYHALTAMAERGISFDGADQGLLNMYFKNSYNRLSFTYNVTPSAHYQYVPAYRHFQSGISALHFIGNEKPWFQGRAASTGSGPFDQMVGSWWAVYDRHYAAKASQGREEEDDDATETVPEIVQYFVTGEYQPKVRYVVSVEEPKDSPEEVGTAASSGSSGESAATGDYKSPTPTAAPAPLMASWDAQRAPPPPGSTPEAANFPQTHYEMSSSTKPFVAPERYPSPPQGMYYEVPKSQTTTPTRAIFPWEAHQPRASRVFAAEPTPTLDTTVTDPVLTSDASSTGNKSEPTTPATPTIKITPSDPWASYERGNAWDDVPEIDKYVDKLPWHRRKSSQPDPDDPVVVGENNEANDGDGNPNETSAAATWRRRGSKLTDFPTAIERPSLPVTPAPVRRPKFWGGGNPGDEDDEAGEENLPTAQGVPGQSDWDPVAQLQLLAKKQSEVLQQRFGQPGEAARSSNDGREIPSRPLPFGSENIISPTYVAPSAPAAAVGISRGSGKSVEEVEEGAGVLLQQQQHRQFHQQQHHRQEDGVDGIPATEDGPSSGIAKPAFQGPGTIFEKGEVYATHATAALPNEEERELFDS